MNIIAAYLPQFHCIPENDNWWGKGFTEWTNVKKARPLFEGHRQPRRPLNNNYYNLLDDGNKTWRWQIDLAKEYGIFGFSIYHYWFNGKLLLEQPVENFLKDKTLEMPFCICWANEKWTNGWVSSENRVLMEQDFSDKEDWINHFMYLLPFFQDKRYIRIDNKPLVIIYVPYLMEKYLEPFLKCWRELAEKNGVNGITFAFQHVRNYNDPKFKKELFDYGMEFQPDFALSRKVENRNFIQAAKETTVNKMFKLSSWLQKNYGIYIHRRRNQRDVKRFSYDEVWEKILSLQPEGGNIIPGAFVDWDNTSRKGKAGSVAVGVTPEKFYGYLKRQIIHAKTVYHQNYMVLFAWNEWAESGYLEPDEDNQYKMLSAVKHALIDTGEFPIR